MPSIVILGAGGFLGRALIASSTVSLPIKAVARNIPSDAHLTQEGVTWIAADLLIPTSLDLVLERDDVVVNLAYMSDASATKNIRLIDNLIEACLRVRVARLVHCSTAVVAGATRASRVSESTKCMPLTAYEQTKWALEQRALNAVSRGLDVGILRPTAIVGPGGQNLLKLARSIQNGSQIVNYLRASLFGKRPMHLVPVGDVAAALLHLAVYPTALSGNVYLVTADDDPENNYQSVEGILLRSLGRAPRKWPLLPIPPQVLSLLLKLRGRSEASMDRMYESQKLRTTKFTPCHSIAVAVREFGENIGKNE